MSEEHIEVTLGRMKLRVPIVEDEQTTRVAAQRVNDRLREIEATSGRVDSYDFALLAAMSFASELTALERRTHREREQAAAEKKADEKELLASLMRFNTLLRDVMDAFHE